MNKWKRVLFVLLAAVLALSLCACGVEKDETVQARTEEMIQALIADDQAASYALISDTVTQEDFALAYPQFQSVFAGAEDYTLQQTYWGANVTNGISTRVGRFQLTVNGQDYVLEAVVLSETGKLGGFHVNVAVTENGTLGSMQGADPVQWGVLLLGLAELAFLLWAFVDVVRQKEFANRAIWAIAVLLGCMTLVWTMTSSSVNLKFNFGTFVNYTALIRYSTGGSTFRLFLPIGAVAYAIMRKKLLKKE